MIDPMTPKMPPKIAPIRPNRPPMSPKTSPNNPPARPIQIGKVNTMTTIRRRDEVFTAVRIFPAHSSKIVLFLNSPDFEVFDGPSVGK
jgi:hypothetical protein